MKKEKLEKEYEELVARIQTERMYDGRGQGVHVYVCEKCGQRFYTRYKDKGVTPLTIKCRKCGKGTAIHKTNVTEGYAKFHRYEVHDWVRPTFEQLQKLSEGAIDHVLNGGLMLDDELIDDEAEIKKKFSQIQEILDSMQKSGATCMFIGHEGNHFVLSGNPVNIAAQIVVAMIRYPVVKEIITKCATHYEELNKECGDDIKNITMTHLIERNSGNKEE